MPIPSPNTGESRSNFIGRCVSFLVNEGRSDEQAFAICYDQYEEANKAEEAQKAQQTRLIQQAINPQPTADPWRQYFS